MKNKDAKGDAKKDEKSAFAKREEEILKFWNERGIFKKSVEKNAKRGDFSFYDGPPFATGLPHYGHLLQSAVKDCIPRYKTMRGYKVERQWGWDCHGLPIENIVEKELGTKSKKEIVSLGVKKFNDLCRERIFSFAKEWERIIPRFGRWADMENPYRTMETKYMESEWWAFKTLFDKGLIYEDYRSMHICPRCETTLSQGEVAEGYKNIKDLSVTAKFELVDEPGTFLLAWTTTPWTLPGNVALAVGGEIKYEVVEIKKEKVIERYIVAHERVESATKGSEYKIVKTISGADLVGEKYKPIFDFYSSNSELKNHKNGWKIYSADFVDTTTGTGIVHIAPAFGADDYALAKKENLPFVQHLGIDGIFKKETGEFAGLNAKPVEDSQKTDVEIIKNLAHRGLLFAKEKIEHSYPHCWRCDTPLLNYATSSWFVAVEKIKEKLLKESEKINWSPMHIKEGRWGDWLKNARDWSISRQRFWANTIPVWRCDKCKKDEVFGSISELKEASGVQVEDLHKDVVDEIKFECKCGGIMQRIPDVLDTWFDSGSVPFATQHYPFENEEIFKKRLPVDFIAEAQDQCRAWFYYQHVLAVALFGDRAFSNCVVTGMVLAEDGKKMSKKLKNYPDPEFIINKYGADAMRLYILGSPVVRTEAINFSEKGVDEVAKKVFGRLVNVWEFYALYKDSISHEQNDLSENVLDKWIISVLRKTHSDVTSYLDSYSIDEAVRPVFDFVDELSVWYLRRSRERVKDGGKEAESALSTLSFVLSEYSKLLAPFAPFHADWLWKNLGGKTESVHLSEWSQVKKEDEEVLKKMREARRIVSLALEARAKNNFPVKQPLSSVQIKTTLSEADEDFLFVIREEINVKSIKVNNEMSEEILFDFNITPELKEEGMLRDILRSIQSARKNANLLPSQFIELKITGNEETRAVVNKFSEKIRKETNAVQILVAEGDFSVSLNTN